MECAFCKELENLKEEDKYYEEEGEKKRKSNIEFYSKEYNVALVSNSFYRGEPTGKISYYGHTLCYCPTCGKKI